VTGLFLYPVASARTETVTSSPDPASESQQTGKRDWSSEYPKLMKLGFKKTPAYLYHKKIKFRDVLEALGLEFKSFSTRSNTIPEATMDYFIILDQRTILRIHFLSKDERNKTEEGFVTATLEHETVEDRNEAIMRTYWRGTIDSTHLRSWHFRMLKPGEWTRGGVRIGEARELFELRSDRDCKFENISPGVYNLRLPVMNSKISLQLPSSLQVSSLNSFPLDMETTITVTGATPEYLFPAAPDLKPDLADVLLDAGFEYKEGFRFEKRGLTFGEAKSITKIHTIYPYSFHEKKRFLKPQYHANSNLGSGSIIFESQEANPTWSDDTKVDVYVYLPPQMDEVVKGLLKKKP